METMLALSADSRQLAGILLLALVTADESKPLGDRRFGDLTREQVLTLRRELERADWIDGRETVGPQGAGVAVDDPQGVRRRQRRGDRAHRLPGRWRGRRS